MWEAGTLAAAVCATVVLWHHQRRPASKQNGPASARTRTPAVFRMTEIGMSTGLLSGYFGARAVLYHPQTPTTMAPPLLYYLLVIASAWMSSFLGGTYYALLVHGPKTRFLWYSLSAQIRVLAGAALAVAVGDNTYGRDLDSAWAPALSAINTGSLVALGASKAWMDLGFSDGATTTRGGDYRNSLPRTSVAMLQTLEAVLVMYALGYVFYAGGGGSRDLLYAGLGVGGQVPPGNLTPSVSVPLTISLLMYMLLLWAGQGAAWTVVVGIPSVAMIFMHLG